jgi:acyl dehydratase
MTQLCWEDVTVGTEIPPYPRIVTLMEINRFAGANDEFLLHHMDRDYSRTVERLPDIIVMGNLKYAYLSNMLHNWIGEGGTLKRLGVQYRGLDFPGPALEKTPTLVCRGSVTKKYIQDGEGYIECRVWVENKAGEVTTPGTAMVIFPGRGTVKEK